MINSGAAIKKRSPVAKMGGIVCTATSIANHVVPQIKHTDTNKMIGKCLCVMATSRLAVDNKVW